MVLDRRAYALIQLLEDEFGSLSAAPENHPYVKIIVTTYGKGRPKEELTERLYLRCPKQMWEDVLEIAKDLEMTRADLLRTWVKRYLKKPYALEPIFEGQKSEQSKTSLYVHSDIKSAFTEQMQLIGGTEFKAMNSIIHRNIQNYKLNKLFF